MKRFFYIALILLCSFSSKSQELHYTVYFDSDKYTIPDTSLLNIIKIITKNNIERVLIEAHCDNIGSKEYNKKLSENRANEAKKLIVENGIQKEFVKQCIGYGKDKPITLNETPFERQLNRRAQITFYAKEKSKSISKDTIISIPIEVKKTSPEIEKFTKAQVGDNIILENLLFQPGRHFLKEESYTILEDILYVMKTYPTLAIEIQGHVCCTTDEPDGYDWDLGTNNLSVMRAKEIYLLLIRNGIDKSRMSFKGFGGRKKIYQDETEEEFRKLNRRVEIQILKK